MNNILTVTRRFIREEDGATAVEYAVVVALIIIGAIAAVTAFGTALTNWFTGTAGTIGGLPTN